MDATSSVQYLPRFAFDEALDLGGNRVAKPSYVCFDNWFPGIERCERESDASCQVELVLVSICCGSVLAVVGLCQVQ